MSNIATNGNDHKVIGTRVPRVDAADKVTGRAQYTADLNIPGMLTGVFVRSQFGHARIKSIDTSKARALAGVVCVLTQDDLSEDQALVIEEEVHATRRVLDLFAKEKVKYHGEKIAAIAAVTREIAEDAASLVKVEYEPIEAYGDPCAAVKGNSLIHEETEPVNAPNIPAIQEKLGNSLNNITGHSKVPDEADGQVDIEKGFSESDHIFEDWYTVPRAHQTYIEPQTCIADVSPDGKVTVWSSTQGHFAVRANIAKSLNIPMDKINSVGMTIGGGFGAKFGGIIDTYTVLLAQRTRRPVKIAYTREDDMLDGRPAPGLVMYLKTGVKKDGTLVARYACALWDVGVGSGASGATGRIKGVYNIPYLKWDGFEVNTNKPAPGAYRAPGGPQASFASEAQLNKIASELGIDPVEFRLKNMTEGDQVDFKGTLKACADKIGWWDREKDTAENEGWGIACGEWTNGAGPGAALVSVHEDGSVHVFSGLMDITGSDSAMAVIAAEILTTPYDTVTVIRGDTDSAPYATPSGGSVVTFSMGNAVQRAAEDAKARLFQLASEELELPINQLELRDAKVIDSEDADNNMSLAELAQLALHTTGGPITGRGSFSSQPSAATIAAQATKLRVDPETGQIEILKYVGALDVGKALHILGVEGQMEGGALQGLSWGIMEQMQYDDKGRMWNPTLLDYRIPTAMDVPYIESVIVEVPTDNGPFGAKGVGEPPISPGIATIQEAVADATGVRINEAPFTPERVAMAVSSNQSKVH